MKPLNVIVVEDSEDDLILIVRALKKVGYDPRCTWVETAAGLKEALADANMPAFSAPEALETLKESGRSLPFIIVSGTIDEKLAATIMESGAGDYVEKGKLSKLGPAVERLLGSQSDRWVIAMNRLVMGSDY